MTIPRSDVNPRHATRIGNNPKSSEKHDDTLDIAGFGGHHWSSLVPKASPRKLTVIRVSDYRITWKIVNKTHFFRPGPPQVLQLLLLQRVQWGTLAHYYSYYYHYSYGSSYSWVHPHRPTKSEKMKLIRFVSLTTLVIWSYPTPPEVVFSFFLCYFTSTPPPSYPPQDEGKNEMTQVN